MGDPEDATRAILSNTRTDGVDPTTIYDAFANPVIDQDVTPAAPAVAANGFDVRWIMIFVAGSLIGGVGTYLVAKRKPKGKVAQREV